MTTGLDRSSITIIDIDDAIAMEEALSEWGGASDPEAESFRSGWRDERWGRRRETSGMNAQAAYLSGVIAARGEA